MRSEYKVEDIIDELTKLSGYVKILQNPDEYFKHMQGHRTELSLVLSTFSIAEMSKDIVYLLNKQIPKKPIDDKVMDEEFWSQTPFERDIKVCPTCKNIYIADKQQYCDKCGQKLNWK